LVNRKEIYAFTAAFLLRGEQGNNIVIFETKEGRLVEFLKVVLCTGKWLKS